MNTIQLTPAWDLTLSPSGDFAFLTGDAAIAQDIASACRLFIGELWYSTATGIPYFGRVLGRPVNPEFIKGQLVAAALTVPGVSAATCFLSSLTNRGLTGQIQATTATGSTVVVPIATTAPGEAITDVSITDGGDITG